MKYEHKRYGVLELPDVEALTQRDLERFMAAYRARPEGNSVSEDAGKTLRAAIAAEWVIAPAMSVDMVDGMKPAQVRWMAQAIDRLYTEATTISPE